MNTTPPSPSPEKPNRTFCSRPWIIVALAAMVLTVFLIATPGGTLTKFDMIGYAVCHRITSHSFSVGGRSLPLCARCTGTFIGALIGFLGQAVILQRQRASEFPSLFIIFFLISFTLLWAADGFNSYMNLIGGPYLYEPRNWLRLTTGALNGLTMSALVYPVFNFTLWRHPTSERTIRNLRELGLLLLIEAGIIGLVLTRRPFLLYPLALLSALGVLTLLTSVNSMLVVMLVQRENVVGSWREASIPLLAGFTVALIQVGAIDWVRYALTGALSGIPPLR